MSLAPALLRLLTCGFLLCGAVATAQAQDAGSTVLIEPSSSKLSMAKAELTVGPLEFKEPGLCGSYKIKVTPFTFKNDHGSLVLVVSAGQMQKFHAGEAAEFTGLATSNKDGKTKKIKGTTAPETKEHGTLSFEVTTEDGVILFNSTYRITAKPIETVAVAAQP